MKTRSTEYKVTIQVDQEWFDVLGTISRHQEGFVWEDVEVLDESTCENCGQYV